MTVERMDDQSNQNPSITKDFKSTLKIFGITVCIDALFLDFIGEYESELNVLCLLA